ncbi:uncharacterized protein BHQ10_001517 [Talaromyces amestolkiae]|uniref:FAD dependent oxidoreductase domain-containing protein n=1 Tax=Talaromyces amestolkiae TaxID=1196081 RepID=A0A364KPP6_TALAM|nr:uncharacterized protein BHQ10_001517 [Talaromyces amestolkiae]RAO65505.1 hypothetical protein BHQ10_001517 [Talaromyces amestolkiae]
MPNLALARIRKDLIGTWKLVSYTSKPAGKDGPIEYPLGKDAKGYIIYTADGYMSAQIMRPGSKFYSSLDPFATADDEAADAARHYLAYNGPFEVIEHEGKVAVKHHADLALVPNWVGSQQLRFCELEGDELVLMPTQPWILNDQFTESPKRKRCLMSHLTLASWASVVPCSCLDLATASQSSLEISPVTHTLTMLPHENPECGVKFVPAIEYFDSADADSFLAKENGYIDWPDFRILKSEEYPVHHEPINLGVTYRSWVLNSPVYLQWCHKQAKEQGAQFIRANVVSMEEAISIFQGQSQGSDADDIQAVINATGRGLNDPDSFPSRGQFIIVSNQCDKTISHHWADGSSTVIIPRPLGGGTVIGGTKEPNSWSEDISDTVTKTILKRVAGICPELIDRADNGTDEAHGFEIRQVYAARRPMRRGGLRLEKEMLSQGIPIVHCYGAGASGFKISWGVAKQVERLISSTQLLVNDPLETS